MPSYAIIGASRGIGTTFLTTISSDPSNTVIGTARNPSAVNVPKRDNLHIIPADFRSLKSLQEAATAVSQLTGGSLDYLILNGAYMNPTNSFFDNFGSPEALDEELHKSIETNVFGYIHAINAFLPLIQAGTAKKVIAITSGLADNDLILNHSIWEEPTYSVSKAALNTVVAKYAARFSPAGILFLCISPGVVATGDKVDPDSEMPRKFVEYAPHFANEGPLTPDQSVKMMLEHVIGKAEVGGKNDEGVTWDGRMVSHFGSAKKWL